MEELKRAEREVANCEKSLEKERKWLEELTRIKHYLRSNGVISKYVSIERHPDLTTTTRFGIPASIEFPSDKIGIKRLVEAFPPVPAVIRLMPKQEFRSARWVFHPKSSVVVGDTAYDIFPITGYSSTSLKWWASIYDGPVMIEWTFDRTDRDLNLRYAPKFDMLSVDPDEEASTSFYEDVYQAGTDMNWALEERPVPSLDTQRSVLWMLRNNAKAVKSVLQTELTADDISEVAALLYPREPS